MRNSPTAVAARPGGLMLYRIIIGALFLSFLMYIATNRMLDTPSTNETSLEQRIERWVAPCLGRCCRATGRCRRCAAGASGLPAAVIAGRCCVWQFLSSRPVAGVAASLRRLGRGWSLLFFVLVFILPPPRASAPTRVLPLARVLTHPVFAALLQSCGCVVAAKYAGLTDVAIPRCCACPRSSVFVHASNALGFACHCRHGRPPPPPPLSLPRRVQAASYTAVV